MRFVWRVILLKSNAQGALVRKKENKSHKSIRIKNRTNIEHTNIKEQLIKCITLSF